MYALSEKLSEIVDRLVKARTSQQAIPQITDTFPEFSIDEAYLVQKELMRREVKAGCKISGYKMGLTSKAKQRDVGLFEPIRGFLTDAMELAAGTKLIASTRIQPRVEPEIAVTFRKTIHGANRFADLVDSIEFIGPALELLDSRFANFKFRLPDVIADNTSASGYLLGATNYRNRLDDLPRLGTVLRLNGEVVATGTPAAVLGHPIHSVLELVQRLSKEETALQSGQCVLTGGITNSINIKAGDWVEVLMPGGAMELRVV